MQEVPVILSFLELAAVILRNLKGAAARVYTVGNQGSKGLQDRPGTGSRQRSPPFLFFGDLETTAIAILHSAALVSFAACQLTAEQIRYPQESILPHTINYMCIPKEQLVVYANTRPFRRLRVKGLARARLLNM